MWQNLRNLRISPQRSEQVHCHSHYMALTSRLIFIAICLFVYKFFFQGLNCFTPRRPLIKSNTSFILILPSLLSISPSLSIAIYCMNSNLFFGGTMTYCYTDALSLAPGIKFFFCQRKSLIIKKISFQQLMFSCLISLSLWTLLICIDNELFHYMRGISP